MNVEIPSSCREDEGGSPKCELGICEKNSSVQINGAAFDDIINVQKGVLVKNSIPTMSRQYDIMVVLEAPGADEDYAGYPTVGQAGKKLTKFITKTNIDPARVYVTHIAKCRPPFNRNPAVKEIQACKPHIEHEIRTLQPKVVMLLGNAALRLFNLHNEGGIVKTRGRHFKVKFPGWDDGPDFWIVPTFHPAKFLHAPDPVAERRCLDDFILASNLAQTGRAETTKRHPFHLINTEDKLLWMLDEIKKGDLLAFDTETRGLNYHVDPMLCLSFCWGFDVDNPGQKTAVLPIYRHSPRPNMLGWNVESFWTGRKPRLELSKVFSLLKSEIFENEKLTKAAHNLSFDRAVIRKWVGTEIKGEYHDTLLMSHLLREQKPHDLEYLADMEFACGNYSSRLHDIVGVGKDKKPYDLIPNHLLWPYAAKDAENVYRLLGLYFYRFNENMFKGGRLYSFYTKSVRPLIEVLGDSTWKGIGVNKQTASIMRADLEQEKDALLSFLKTLTKNPEFNPSSPEEVNQAAIADGMIEHIRDPKKVSGLSAAKGKLLEIVDLWPPAKHILRYRHITKTASTYLRTIIEEAGPDGRIRKSFMIHGTDSGRLSASLLHQIPKGDKLRSIFQAQDKYAFVHSDFRQIEMKVYAILMFLLTGNRKLMDLCLDPKIDMHKRSCSIFLGQDKISDFNRDTIGKTINFGVIYGCLAAGTRILMSNGLYKNIEHIVPGDNIINMNGESVAVKKLYNRGDRDVIAIRNSIWGDKTFVTPEHKFYVGDLSSWSEKSVTTRGYKDALRCSTRLGQSKIKWKDIGTKDRHTFLMPRYISFNLPETFSIRLEKNHKLNRVLYPSYELGYILGTFLGDGTVRYSLNKGGLISWSFGKNEMTIAKKLQQAIKLCLELETNLYYRKNMIIVNLCYTSLAKLFNTFGKKANKFLPAEFIVNDKIYLKGVHDGLMDSDGCYSTMTTFSNSSLHLTELFGVVTYLLTGIWPNIHKLDINISKLIKKSNQPRRTSILLRTGRSRVLNKYQVSKVLEKTKILNTQSQVYDIEVDCPTHSFIANNAIVHNSEGTDLVGREYEKADGSKALTDWGMVNLGILNIHNEFPGIREYNSLVPDLARAQNGVYTSVFGRERRLGLKALTSVNNSVRMEAERILVNFSIQSPAAQITSDSAIILYQTIKEMEEKGQLKPDHFRVACNTVHDSLLNEVRKELGPWAVGLTKQVCERPIPELINTSFTVDIGLGSTWAEAEAKSKGK